MRLLVLALGGAVLVACKEPHRPGEPPFPEGVPPRAELEAFDGGLSDARHPESTGADQALDVLADAGLGATGAEAADARRRAPAPDSSVVLSLRERTLRVSPERVPAQRVAFASDRLVVLTETELVTRSTANWEVMSRVAVEEPRRVLTARDGSVLVLGQRATHRIAIRPAAFETHGPLPLFPDTLVFPDRLAEDLVWVKHPFGTSLYSYRLGTGTSSLLGLSSAQELLGHDGRALLGLRDGSFVFTSPGHLHQLFPRGRHLKAAAKVAEASVWRLLPAKRIDQIWVAREDGHVELVQIGEPFVSLRSLEVGPGVFDVAASQKYLASVLVEQGDGRPRRWKLRVLEASGEPALMVDLPPDSVEPRGADWVKQVTRDRHVVLSDHAPLVAVGGPRWIGVFDVKTGAALFTGAP